MSEWSTSFEQLAEKQGKRIHTVVRQFALSLFSRVVKRSPVDTGRFRANWNVSYGAPDTSTMTRVDPTGGTTTNAIKQAVLSLPVGATIWLANSLPYARTLEYGEYPNPAKHGSKKRKETEMTIHTVGGFSMQAPHGMVRVSVAEYAAAMKEAIEAP